MQCKKHLLFALLIIFFSNKIQAQEIKSFIQDTVRVISTMDRSMDSSLRIQIIEIPDLQLLQSRGQNLNDVLRFIPGVISSNRNNVAIGERLSIRGSGWQSAFGVRGVQIEYGELPLTTVDGQSMLEIIEPVSITTLDAILGSSAVIYGNSSGGYLRFNSQNYSNSIIQFQAGAFDNYQTYASIPFSNNESIGVITASWNQNRGFREHSSSEILRFSIQNVNNVPLGIHKMQLNSVFVPQSQHPGALTLSDFEVEPKSANGFFQAQDAGKELNHIALSNSLEIDNKWKIKHFIQVRDIDNPLTFAYLKLNRIHTGFKSDYKLATTFGETRFFQDITFQLDKRSQFENNGGNKGAQILDQEEFLQQYGTGLLQTFQLERFKLNAGLRLDYYQFDQTDLFLSDGDDSGNRFFVIPGYSFNVNWTNQISAYNVSFRSAYNIPTTTELLNRPDGGIGFNPNLNSEQQYTLEANYSRNWFGDWNIALYQTWISDIKVSYESEIQPGRTLYANSGNGIFKGIEFSYSTDHFKNQKYNFQINYFYSNINSEGHKSSIPGIPELYYSFNHIFSWNKWMLGNDVIFNGKQYLRFQSSETYPSWLRWDFVISYQMQKRMTASIRLENVLNEQYASNISINAFGNRYYESGLPRNLLVSLRLNI